MKHTELQLQSNDGLPLFAQVWAPDDKIKGVLCLVHGLGEHSGRYAHWAGRLSRAGYALAAPDLRGHGRSGGLRGHTPSIDHYGDDLSVLFCEASAPFAGKPCFLYGHSMGGLLALFYLIQRQPGFTGAVVTSPGLHSAIQEQKTKVAVTRLLGFIAPRLTLPSGLEQEYLSRDPDVIDRYRNDPLVHDQISVGWGRVLLEMIKCIFERAHEIDLPLLLMHGTEDRIAFASGSEKLAGLVSGECTLKLWNSLYHELHNEPEKDEVFAYLVKWLDEQTQKNTN